MPSGYRHFLLEVAASTTDDPFFVSVGDPASDAELAAAEASLGVELPPSYKTFVLSLGPGLWCGEAVKAPSALYAFDEDCEDMEGFIALVENVQGVGDHLAINPVESATSNERPLYYCGHDPFGQARLADTFEAWTRQALQARIADEPLYDEVERRIAPAQSRPHSPRPRRWWQFWR